MLTTNSVAFDKILLRAIDEAPNSLGESVRQAIYFHIKNKFSVDRNEIPENLQQFQEGLKEIFLAGAQFIEILIMQKLARKDWKRAGNTEKQKARIHGILGRV